MARRLGTLQFCMLAPRQFVPAIGVQAVLQPSKDPMSALKNIAIKHVVRILTHPATRQWQRTRASLVRRIKGAAAQVHYFHQTDDPYSHLCVQLLERLGRGYDVDLLAHLVSAPEDSAAPDRERLGHWSLRDATLLAQAHGLEAPALSPDAGALASAESRLAASLQAGRFVVDAAAISQRLWSGQPQPEGLVQGHSQADAQAAKAAGTALRKQLGHYLGATFFYGGEWYWGIDRLHYLEQRLRDEGLCREPARALLVPVRDIALPGAPALHGGRKPTAQLHYFCSFRSPYTYIALPRARQLAEHYGAQLQIRFVLPMVMRGLAVPREKGMYIVADVAREAQRVGMPYGFLVDPVGKPVERGYAVLHQAMKSGAGLQLAQSFLQGVWADGIDAGTDSGLYAIALRAGLDKAFVDKALADDSWRAAAATNRLELLDMDLWGVPSFRVNDLPGYWGQDRLWMVEQDLMALR
jgi:2-hydroxychromene-2-carboxylate isomerase